MTPPLFTEHFFRIIRKMLRILRKIVLLFSADRMADNSGSKNSLC